MNTTDILADERKRLEARVDNAELNTLEDAKTFITDLTTLIYDYKMIGKIYDYYDEHVEYYKQNKIVFTHVEDVVRSVAEFCSAFPNLTTKMEHLIAYKVDDDFFKISKRLRYHGNNYGWSAYGAPTGKSLADNCLSMSLIHLKRIDGKWKIVFEINNDSEAWLEEVQTPDLPKGTADKAAAPSAAPEAEQASSPAE